jgi:DDE superfamily endonuclease
MPTLPGLERCPIRRAIPGSIEQQEFEYTRHGTVNILVFLVVHTGQMEAVIVEKKDAVHYIQALERFLQRHHRLKGVFLIQDGDPSHTAGNTQNYLTNANT